MDGTTTKGEDYVSANHTVTITSNGTDCSYQIQLNHDDHDEGLETFSVTLTTSDPNVGIRPGHGRATVTIISDDGEYDSFIYFYENVSSRNFVYPIPMDNLHYRLIFDHDNEKI